MAYTVLARRYRSQTFDDVVGQGAISHTLKNAIKTGRIAHAYLFSGTRGVGKTTMARILAKSLNCLESTEPIIKPCLKCDSCIKVNTGEDIDVIEIDGASNRGIESIRELRQNASYRPARGRFKIYIIDEVHMLTTDAFNALLKILEEPPSHVKFIFATTEPNKVLATIQSRCQRFDFANISPTDIIGQLKKILAEEKIDFQEDCLISLARLANGSMRDGLSLLDQLLSAADGELTVDMLTEFLGQPSREKIFSLLSNIGSSDAKEALSCLDELLNSGMSCIGVLDGLISASRDLMVLKASGNAPTSAVILTESEKQTLSAMSELFDISSLVYNVTLLEKLRWPVKNSDNPRALFEAALLRLVLSEHFMNIADLLKGCTSDSRSRTAVKKNFSAPKPALQQPVNNNSTPIKTPSTAVLDSSADIEQIKSNWPAVISFARSNSAGRIGNLLQKCVPVSLRGNNLSLGFKPEDEFSMKLCQNNGKTEMINSALSGALGKNITAVFQLISTDKPVKPIAKPRGAKTSQKTMDQAANKPAVKTVLFGLDASIIDVTEEPTQ